MEILIRISFYILLSGIVIIPMIILKNVNKTETKYKFLNYFLISYVIVAILGLCIAWWSQFSYDILLHYYGYDFDGMADIEYYKNVDSKDIPRVKSLLQSRSGIGWPLKFIMSFAFYTPILWIIFIINFYLNKNIKSRRKEGTI